jgi:hypothetical protein
MTSTEVTLTLALALALALNLNLTLTLTLALTLARTLMTLTPTQSKSAWAKLIGHNAPLYDDPAYAAAGGDGRFHINWGVDKWLAKVPASKLVLGLPAYGRGWTSPTPTQYVSNDNNGALAGTWEAGVFSWWDIAQNYIGKPGWTRYWNDVAKVTPSPGPGPGPGPIPIPSPHPSPSPDPDPDPSPDTSSNPD